MQSIRQRVNKAAAEQGYLVKIYLDCYLLIKKDDAKIYPMPALVFNSLADMDGWLNGNV
jgi:hypothetical protein